METLYQDSSASATISLTGEKVCRKCKEKRHVTEFQPRPPTLTRRGDGRLNTCKPCKRAYDIERQTRLKGQYLANRAALMRAFRTEVLHYGVDEKFGDTWQLLDAALSMCQRITPLQKAA